MSFQDAVWTSLRTCYKSMTINTGRADLRGPSSSPVRAISQQWGGARSRQLPSGQIFHLTKAAIHLAIHYPVTALFSQQQKSHSGLEQCSWWHLQASRYNSVKYSASNKRHSPIREDEVLVLLDVFQMTVSTSSSQQQVHGVCKWWCLMFCIQKSPGSHPIPPSVSTHITNTDETREQKCVLTDREALTLSNEGDSSNSQGL